MPASVLIVVSSFIRRSKVELLTLDLAMADENHMASIIFCEKVQMADT